MRFAPSDVNKLPVTQPRKFEDIQFVFRDESEVEKDIRELRRTQVREVFGRAWSSYVENAWLADELQPISGKNSSSFGGWGATLVDSLDTLWIMGMRDEFEIAVEAASSINFNTSETETINVFETTIRYLGGFLGAYDISDGAYPILLAKATEVGELLYRAFDTPNRMPLTRWDRELAFENFSQRKQQEASDATLVAELGSLTLEFTRLSQLTGNSKYYDAVYTIMRAFESSQQKTKLPGLWPTVVNAKALTFTDSHFTVGGMADSVYEYLPKQYLLLGGTVSSYKTMYEHALSAMKSYIFFRPMVPEPTSQPDSHLEGTSRDNPKTSQAAVADVLLPGNAVFDPRVKKLMLDPEVQHLGCFAGGMVALAAKVFGTEANDIPIAQRLVNGCVWAYGSMPTGIMPEISHLAPCREVRACDWDEEKWHTGLLNRQRITDEQLRDLPPEAKVSWLIKERGLKPGYTALDDPQYILRPEAIESIFVLYRLTGDAKLIEAGWQMFEAVERNTATELGNAAISDVSVSSEPEKIDRMESFWLAETLKYFYLLFSEPDLVSLDRYVLYVIPLFCFCVPAHGRQSIHTEANLSRNTEAHPFKRPVPGPLLSVDT